MKALGRSVSVDGCGSGGGDGCCCCCSVDDDDDDDGTVLFVSVDIVEKVKFSARVDHIEG